MGHGPVPVDSRLRHATQPRLTGRGAGLGEGAKGLKKDGLAALAGNRDGNGLHGVNGVA